MSIYKTQETARKNQDTEAYAATLHDDYEFISHMDGMTMNKEKAMEMLINLSGEADENYREHLIFQLKREKLLPAAFGRAFKSLNTPYFAQHGDFIVFANSKLLLKTTINNYISNKTWVNSEGFQSVASQFSKSANIWTMVKNPGAFNLASMYMNDADKKAFVKNKTIFSVFNVYFRTTIF